ncbi:4'-phosphopantetheinyl transferase family protein [Pseudochelatococcus sp. G4_1912]|uniref:4'-phosphopantetheinyl transferase family protein n=1 Tax=Pseudochelatococcus sp. G4_1912 TaxID=3114288 RepID=UPI0039C62FC8
MHDKHPIIDIWIARLDEPEVLGVPNSIWDDILSTEERERRSRLRFSNDRNLFTLSRVLLRTRLSEYASVSPQAWEFVQGRFGKPMLSPRLMEAHGLHFSLSHANSTAVCAITRSGPVGVDVESLDRELDVDALAKPVLTPDEQASLTGLAEPLKRHRFLTFWTLKEAYLKARGVGLSVPLQSFSFTGYPPRLVETEESRDNVGNWVFDSRTYPNNDIVSYALYQGQLFDNEV